MNLVDTIECNNRPINWLWPGWISCGHVHLLAGSPGVGKSTLACYIAAVVSRGGMWPDGTQAPKGNVWLWSNCDDEYTTVTRIAEAGGDLDNVFLIKDARAANVGAPFDPSRHIQNLLDCPGKLALIILDTVGFSVADARSTMNLLVNLAKRRQFAVLAITYTSKDRSKTRALDRVLFKTAMTDVASVVMEKSETDQVRSKQMCL